MPKFKIKVNTYYNEDYFHLAFNSNLFITLSLEIKITHNPKIYKQIKIYIVKD